MAIWIDGELQKEVFQTGKHIWLSEHDFGS